MINPDVPGHSIQFAKTVSVFVSESIRASSPNNKQNVSASSTRLDLVSKQSFSGNQTEVPAFNVKSTQGAQLGSFIL